MNTRNSLKVLSLISCLTICQVSHVVVAAGFQTRNAPRTGTRQVTRAQVAAQARALPRLPTYKGVPPANQDPALYDGPGPATVAPAAAPVAETSTAAPIRKKKTMTDYAQTPLLQLPADKEAVVEVDLNGYNHKSSGTTNPVINGLAYKTKIQSKSNGYMTSVGGRFGLTENIYFGGGLNYGKSETSTDVSGANNGVIFPYTSKTKSDGFAEPELNAGLHFMAGRNRIVTEVAGTVPMGNSIEKRDTISHQTDGDNKTGNFSISGRGLLISELPTVRLVTTVSYKYLADRTRDIEESTGYSVTKYSEDISGGNIATLLGAVEFPRMWNLGLGAQYQQNEESQSKRSDNGVTTTSSGIRFGTLLAYGSIALNEQFKLVPRFEYSTPVDKSSLDGYDLEKFDLYKFSMGAVMKF